MVDRVRQVNRQQMYGMYLLRKEEMETENGRTGTAVKELVLYHATTEDKGVESLNGGLDWRRTKRSRYRRGVSFSDDVDYADYYANRSAGESNLGKNFTIRLARRICYDQVPPPFSLSVVLSRRQLDRYDNKYIDIK